MIIFGIMSFSYHFIKICFCDFSIFFSFWKFLDNRSYLFFYILRMEKDMFNSIYHESSRSGAGILFTLGVGGRLRSANNVLLILLYWGMGVGGG